MVIEIALLAGGAWAIRKTVGPAIDSFGNSFGAWSELRSKNLFKLNDKVAKRLEAGPDDADVEDAGVHARVAAKIIDEGSWIDDDVHQEYLAGLLVSARSAGSRSDASAYLTSVVTALTADQVRLHYAVMSSYAGMWDGKGDCPFPIARKDHYRQQSVIAPNEEALKLCDNYPLAAKGLVREGLLQDYGRPIAGLEQETHQVFVPAPLAFDIYVAGLGTRPMLPQALLLDRALIPGYFTEPEGAVTFTAAKIGNPGG